MSREYSDDYRISWYRSPIDKTQLGQLMKRRNLRGWPGIREQRGAS